MQKKTILLDFDGTVVEHKFPSIGALLPNVKNVIDQLRKKQHTIILNTYRINLSYDTDDITFSECVEFLFNNDILYDGQVYMKKTPTPWNLDDDFIYIDDLTSEIPMLGAVVDWFSVEKELKEKGII